MPSNPGTADQVLTPDYTVHFVGMVQPISGLSAWIQVIPGYFTAFPDLQLELREDISEVDGVGVRYVWTGTQRSGFTAIPPTPRAPGENG